MFSNPKNQTGHSKLSFKLCIWVPMCDLLTGGFSVQNKWKWNKLENYHWQKMQKYECEYKKLWLNLWSYNHHKRFGAKSCFNQKYETSNENSK